MARHAVIGATLLSDGETYETQLTQNSEGGLEKVFL